MSGARLFGIADALDSDAWYTPPCAGSLPHREGPHACSPPSPPPVRPVRSSHPLPNLHRAQGMRRPEGPGTSPPAWHGSHDNPPCVDGTPARSLYPPHTRRHPHMTAHRHTINIHANQDGMGPLPVAVDTYDTFVSVRLGDVSFFIPDLAAAADLSERISIAVTAAMLDAAAGDPLPFDLHDVSRRLRTMRYREQIAELTAEEYEAEARGERLADAIAAEDGAA